MSVKTFNAKLNELKNNPQADKEELAIYELFAELIKNGCHNDESLRNEIEQQTFFALAAYGVKEIRSTSTKDPKKISQFYTEVKQLLLSPEQPQNN